MAVTQADLDALDRAIASGLLKVRYADGSEMTYRSHDELLRVRAMVAERLAPPPAGGGNPRVSLASF